MNPLNPNGSLAEPGATAAGPGATGPGTAGAAEPGVAGVPAPRRPGDDHAPANGTGGRRDQYIDGLRAIALIRVMTYHTFGWVWLPVVFPSMGVMFALGGSLVAASLTRARGRHWQVLRKRIRRLLPPLWLYGAVLVAVMSAHGWTLTETAGAPLTWRSATSWVVPLADPPGSAWGYDFVLPLWYIRTYLWLLLLSPIALWLFRRFPVAVLLAPPAVLLTIAAGAIETSTATGDTIEHLATFGACWLLGFAHHEGLIKRLPRGRAVLAAVALMMAGLAYALARPQPDTGWDIDNISVADAAYSAGAVLLLLRLYPRRTFLERTPRLSRLVTAMNSRAMTIYLWGNVAIWAATPVIESNPLTGSLESNDAAGRGMQFAIAWLVLVVLVLAFGWAEDVAAGRRARINPWPRPQSTQAAAPEARSGRSRRAPRTLTGIAVLATALVTSLIVGVVVTPGAAARSGPLGPLPVAGPVAQAPGAPSLSRYPLHERIPATVFWVGTVSAQGAGGDGQSLISAWDSAWAEHFGGCDGVGAAGRECASDVERRTAPDWFPTATVPRENPYYVGLPYNDLFSPKSTDRYRIPWAADQGFAIHLNDRTVSFMKNRWVGVTGPAGTCYAQIEDSGPGAVDPDYVLGAGRPSSPHGINLSPAVTRCVGLAAEAGGGDVGWRFVDAPPPGPWSRVITSRQVS